MANNLAWINLEKTTYTAGDQVNGYVNIVLSSSVPSHSLQLEFIGEEFVSLIKMESESYDRLNSEGETVEHTRQVPQNYSQNRVFYNFKQPLSTFSQTQIPPGQYQLPFSFVLGKQTPSTFKHSWKVGFHQCEAQVFYEFAIHVGGLCVVRKELLVVSSCQESSKNHSLQAVDQKVEVCCFKYGSTSLKAYFEKDKYNIGSKAYVVCEVDNSSSQKPVSEVVAKLEQVYEFSAEGQSSKCSKTIRRVSSSGIGPGEALTGQNAQRMEILMKGESQGDLKPSCYGHLIKCYHILSV